MVLLVTSSKAQKKLTENVRLRRLDMNLTQEGLAERSGVPLSTLRKFEQKGSISLQAFLKLHAVLGGLESLVTSLELTKQSFSSIDEVLEDDNKSSRQRGRRK